MEIDMKLKKIKILLLFGLLVPAIASAVSEEDFKVTTTQDLVDLCTTPDTDAKYQEAIHFCHGYLVGAYHYHYMANEGPKSEQKICFPDPRPTRNAAIGEVVSWMQKHPEYMNETPVETAFRSLHDLWPCKK